MVDLFYSARLTLARAQYHINDFNSLIKGFIQSQPYTIFIDKECNSGKDTHKLRFAERLPDILPCVLFDAVNNLRAALDQAGYAAARASGKVTPKKTNFPFADDSTALDNQIDRRHVCDDLPAEIVAYFRGLKPYEGGDNILWALNKLCNTKKHCALVPGKIDSISSIVIYESDATGASSAFLAPRDTWDPQKHEMILMVTEPGAQPNIRGHIAFSVELSEILALRGIHAGQLLLNMFKLVQNIVFTTETICRHLGFKLSD
jgi:hypothetical protein